MAKDAWHDLGPAEPFQRKPLTEVTVGRTKIAITCVDGQLGAISNLCTHVGGPLGQGRIDGEYVVCPWHNWKFHCRSGKAEPPYTDAVPSYALRVENGRLLVNPEPLTPRHRSEHPPHALERPIRREDGPIRVVGISTTAMDAANPRYSTSDALLNVSLERAAALGCETKLLRLNDLRFRACEGYYSKSAHACTWPCSITQMDEKDEMTPVYEALVFWADAVILATPIRWGAASSLYYKMAERLNCVQNQVTIRNRVLIRNKVASFIITGGQDNVQAVAGQLLGFFAELGFLFPQFPYIAHSRGWTSEDMERNVAYVMHSKELREGAEELAQRTIETARLLLQAERVVEKTARGGRKAHPLDVAAS